MIIILLVLLGLSLLGWLICNYNKRLLRKEIEVRKEMSHADQKQLSAAHEKIYTLEMENALMRDKKPHHKSKVVITCEVETSYDQKPENKCSLLLRAASMYDKNYTIEITDLGPVERNS